MATQRVFLSFIVHLMKVSYVYWKKQPSKFWVLWPASAFLWPDPAASFTAARPLQRMCIHKWKLLAWKMPGQIPPFALLCFLKIHFGDFESPCCLFTVSFSPFLSCLHVCVWVCSWLACSRNSKPIVGPVQRLEMLTPGKPHWGSSGWGKMAIILILWMCVYFCSSRAPAKRVSAADSGCCLLGDGELQLPVESSASRNSKPMKTASFRSQCDSQLNTGRGQ